MHSSSFDVETQRFCSGDGGGGGDVLVALTALVTEGRIPGKSAAAKSRGFYEGPHCCSVLKNSKEQHDCNRNDELCQKYEQVRNEVLNLWQRRIPLCVDVLLSMVCPCASEETSGGSDKDHQNEDILLEKWYISVLRNRSSDVCTFNFNQLINAIRSQLYFSQISAWLSSQAEEDKEGARLKISSNNLKYNLTIPGETFERCKFSPSIAVNTHDFPLADIGNGYQLKVTLKSLPRMAPPTLDCKQCAADATTSAQSEPTPAKSEATDEMFLLDDRMHLSCTLKGKHRCEDVDDFELRKEQRVGSFKRVCCYGEASTSKAAATAGNASEKRNCNPQVEQSPKTPKLDFKSNADLKKQQHQNDEGGAPAGASRSDVFLQAILRSCRLQDEPISSTSSGDTTSTASCNPSCSSSPRDVKCVQRLGELGTHLLSGCARALQKSVSDINSDKQADKRDIAPSCSNRGSGKIAVYADCDNGGGPAATANTGTAGTKKMRDISNLQLAVGDDKHKQHESNIIDIPSPNAKAKFRKSLDNAANMVFHARTGLPLTSSPAPVRRGKFNFDFDSSINSVSDIKSALFSTSISTDDDSESDGSIVSPCSPETYYPKKQPSPVKHYRRSNAANLLGSFEESVLNGRLEPVSTVHGFTAELGASGSFVPRHLVVPVTVFFYTLGDNDKVSSPYLGHINLGKKGYMVPKTGTVQVTLFNPLGTVVKMFVIMYDLSDMPPNSQTFIRQRTLYMPAECTDRHLEEWGPKWLRYLVHLRFLSSKSGRIYLHSDVRMIIFRKADVDTATAHGIDMCYELRSFTHMPANPKYSPRK